MRKADRTPRKEHKADPLADCFCAEHQFCFILPRQRIPSTFSNSALTLSPHNLHVQMGQPAGSGQGEFDHPLDSHRVAIKVIKERSVLVVIGDEPQLSPRSIICSRKETVLRERKHGDGKATEHFAALLVRGELLGKAAAQQVNKVKNFKAKHDFVSYS